MNDHTFECQCMMCRIQRGDLESPSQLEQIAALTAECKKLHEENARLGKMLSDRVMGKLDKAVETIMNDKDEREAYHKELQLENTRLHEEKAVAEKMAIDSLLLSQESINTLAKATGIDSNPIMAGALADANEKMNKAIASFAAEHWKERKRSD